MGPSCSPQCGGLSRTLRHRPAHSLDLRRLAMGKLAPPTLLASLSLGAVLAAGVVAPASAAVVDVVWNFNVPSGALGPSESYTSMGYTITASGFTGAWSPVDLYG